MRFLVLVLACGYLGSASAAEETLSASGTDSGSVSGSRTKLKDVLGDKKFEENKAINDLELRAQAGSLSRYSLQFSLGYSGPAVNELADPNVPNPDNRPGDHRTSLGGSMGLRYRTTSSTAINLSTGVRLFTPVQAVKGEEVDRKAGTHNYDINNPGISFDGTYAVGPTQMRSSVRASATTEDYYKGVGQWAAAGYTQAVKYTPLMGRVILGAQLALDYFAYDRDYRTANAKGKGGDGNVSRYFINFIPSFEYKLTDALNFNTSLGYPYQNLRANSNSYNWSHQLSTWRVGFGWAITHDIYINPYVNFFAESPAFNTASASFNTVFSIF